MVALSMADGYARLTGKPQCVIVHVDVGTQGLGAAVHNASCGRAPVLIFAGLSPFTIEGEMRGSRTEYIHWIQDVPDQKQIVAQYCRYTGEIKSGRNVKVRNEETLHQDEADAMVANGQPCPLIRNERSKGPSLSIRSARTHGRRFDSLQARIRVLASRRARSSPS
jgi:hypothetical protein